MTPSTTRVLDAARQGRVMAWVLAIMLFLTILAAAAAIGTAAAAGALGRELAGRATVQVTAADPPVRQATAARVLAALRQSSAVRHAEPVPAAELERLLGPWLGEAGNDDLPIPALIDIDLADRVDAVERVRTLLRQVAPGATLERHGDAMAPVGRLLTSFTTLAVVLVALMATATGAVVVLAARAGLDAHRTTIEVMHGLGATDVQVARLFQRRIALDAALGALVGGVAAWIVVAVLGWQVAAAGSQLLGGAALGQGGWIAIIALPFVFVALAATVARRTVTASLARTL
ncbi:MAG: permease [Sphingomonas adhaesiva]|uniref:cell division protein FtsX n=1 Tax=Sphingomonas adhaesiva TaxID=28212 RepID=UPI002FF95476